MTSELAVYFLDVGQGDCSLVIAPSGDAVLIDCADAAVALHVLKASGIDVLEAVVVSHLDADHIRGVNDFIKTFMNNGGTIRHLFVDKDRPGLLSAASELAALAIKLHKEKKLVVRSATRRSTALPPEIVLEGPDWCIDILSPEYAARFEHDVREKPAPNTLSAIVRARYGSQSVVIGGDAPLGAWERVECDLVDIRAVRAPHHGGDISEGRSRWTLEAFYEKLAPDVTVFSVGTNNSYEHPCREHIEAARAGRGCRRICTQLTARCDRDPIRKGADHPSKTASVLYPYRHQRRRAKAETPCAGSVLLTMDSSGVLRVEPTENGWHDKFVRCLDHPLCLC